MNNITHNICDVPLRDDSRIQILEDIDDLPRARKHQYAAFIREDCRRWGITAKGRMWRR